MYDRKKFRSAQNVTDVTFFCSVIFIDIIFADVILRITTIEAKRTTLKKRHIRDILGRTIFSCHAYDTSVTIFVTKPGIIIDVVGSYLYDKKS